MQLLLQAEAENTRHQATYLEQQAEAYYMLQQQQQQIEYLQEQQKAQKAQKEGQNVQGQALQQAQRAEVQQVQVKSQIEARCEEQSISNSSFSCHNYHKAIKY